MDKTIELDRRGAELKAEIGRYRKWFRTRAVSLELKRAAVAFVDEGVAIGMWPGHAAGLIGSTPPHHRELARGDHPGRHGGDRCCGRGTGR